MTFDLITNDAAEYSAELAALLGVDGAGFTETTQLPQLKVNYSHEADDGARLPAGSFYVKLPASDNQAERTLYAKEVTFRPFVNRFQFLHYDATGNDGKGAFLNKSIYVPDFKTEALDELGGTRCGKLTTKQYEELGTKITPAQNKLKQDVKLFRVIFGTVSLEGKTAAGEEHNLVSVPVVLKLRGVNFSPIGYVFKKLDSLKRLPFSAGLTLTTKREKKGTLTYYVVQFAFDQSISLRALPEDITLVNKFSETINAENAWVIKKHKKSKEGSDQTDVAEDVNDALNEDFNDDIPF
jgi:hypothetical protein